MKTIIYIFWIFAVLYALICIIVYIKQESFLFYPQKTNKKIENAIFKKYTKLEKINTLSGISWYFLPRYHDGNSTNLKPIIIYFWWNAEEISDIFLFAEKISDYSIISFNYRWYWDSKWTISKSIFDDLDEIYSYTEHRFPNTKKTLLWRSIWTAMASYLRSKYNLTLVLLTPFDRINNLAKQKFPFLPINLLLKYDFDNIKNINSNTSLEKIIIFISENDEVIEPRFAQNLFEKINSSNKTKIILKWALHNNVLSNNQFWEDLNLNLSK